MGRCLLKNAVEEQLSSSSGKPGRKPSVAPASVDLFLPSKRQSGMAFYESIRGTLPDPDEIFRAGGLGYVDYYSLERDSHATSCIEQRTSQTLSHAIRVELGPLAQLSGGTDAEKARVVCARMVLKWGQKGVYNFLLNTMYAKFMGMQPFELNWYRDCETDWNMIDVPSDLLQEWFVYTPDGHLRILPNEMSLLAKPVPPFKVYMARHKETLRNPYGVKLLSACYWPITFKRGFLRFSAEYAERFGMPMLHVKSASKDEKSMLRFAAKLQKMMRRGIVMSNGDFQVDNLDMDSKYQTTHLYDSFMDSMDKEVSKALLGQTLTTDEGGSRAQGDIHKQILEMLWKTDAQFCACALNDLFQLVTFVNTGSTDSAPQALVGEAMGLERLERDKTLRDFHGIEFSDEYLARHYSLRQGDFKRVDPLKASYKNLPDSGMSPKDGGSRKSEAATTDKAKRENHRERKA